MCTSLIDTKRCAEEYSRSEQSAWDRIKVAHDQAMFAKDVDDLVDYGTFVLRIWLRQAKKWHEYVSESMDRYNEDDHNQLKEVEKLAVGATKGTLGLIDEIKKRGFGVEGEAVFRMLAEELIGAAMPPLEQFADKPFGELGRIAIRDHQNNQTQPIEHWGE